MQFPPREYLTIFTCRSDDYLCTRLTAALTDSLPNTPKEGEVRGWRKGMGKRYRWKKEVEEKDQE